MGSNEEVSNPTFEEEGSPSREREAPAREKQLKKSKSARAKGFVKRHVHHHHHLHKHTDALEAHQFNHELEENSAGASAHIRHHFMKVGKASVHSSMREATEAELIKAGVDRKDIENVLDSPEMEKLREAFGENHVPSTRMLLHLAKAQRKKDRDDSVAPEMIAAGSEPAGSDPAESTGESAESESAESAAVSHTIGASSVGQKLFEWTSGDSDIPLWLMAEERNSTARRRIQKTILLDPDCGLCQAWDATQFVLLVYLAFDLPYRVGFNVGLPRLYSPDFWLGAAVDAFFVFDILLSFITCFYNPDGLLVAEPRKIMIRYAKSWFLIDFVSILPLNYLEYLEMMDELEQTVNPQALKLVKLLRLIKLLRLARLHRLLKKYESKFFVFFQRMKAANLVLGILAVGHWTACLWNYVGSTVDEVGNPVGWVADVIAHRLGETNQSGTTTLPPDEIYVLSYFAAIYSLIAGGVPFTTTTASQSEFVFSCVAIIGGGFVYANVVGNITELNRKNNMEADIKANAVARSMAMCRATGMDSFLRKKIMEQIRFDIDNAPDREYVTDFMDAMPSNLEVAFAQHLGWVPKMVSKPLHPLPRDSLPTPPSYSRVPALLSALFSRKLQQPVSFCSVDDSSRIA